MTSGGRTAGTDRVEKIQGGCALQETWNGAQGDTGISLNTYYLPEGRWHQIWVSNLGAFLEISGKFKDGKRVLTGESVGPRNGVRVLNRISWSLGNGNLEQVRQLWQVLSAGGQTGRVEFDGLYTRKK